MALYEMIFIARQDLSPAQVENLIEKFSGIVQENGGSVSKTEYIGLRNLASLIKKYHKGHYALMNISAEAATLKEVERLLKLNEDILRFLTVKVEEHEKGPSALLKASRHSRDEFDNGPESRFDSEDKSERPSHHPSQRDEQEAEEREI